MQSTRFRITLKVLLGYLALAVLAIAAGWYLYGEIARYLSLQRESLSNQSKVFRVSELLSELYQNESYARVAVRSEQRENFEVFLIQNEKLIEKIDSLKEIIPVAKQIALIDSTKILLQKKADNYHELRAIFTNNNTDAYLKTAIEKLSNIETVLGKVNIEDFRKNPEILSPRERALMSEIVNLLNKNRPEKENRKLDEQTIDSIVVTTKQLLSKVKADAATQQRIIAGAENALWENDNIISQQIRQILTNIESEVYENYTQLAQERNRLLKSNSTLLLLASIAGILIALLFSFLILNDFFHSQKLRKELEKANELTSSLLRNREQLLSTVSHDLRSPLSSLLGYTAMIKQTQLDKKQLYYLENMDQSAQYVNKLSNDLLDYAKLESQKIKIEHRVFVLKNTIEEVVNLFMNSLDEKPIGLTIEFDHDLKDNLIGDPFRIKQILTNLLGNAIKFTESGSIKVKTRIIDRFKNIQKVAISIQDTGIGIEKERQTDIFKEFTQASESIEKKFGGAGLGLAISKRLAELMGGSLSLESSPGKGSIFTLKIPLEIPDRKETIATYSPKTGQPLRIIVTDDDAAILSLIEEILKQYRVKVYCFGKVQKTLDFMEKYPFDLAVTDIEMPMQTGIDFLNLIRNNPKYGYKNQPVIAITGRTKTENDSFVKMGFSAVINKPFLPEQLLVTLQKFGDIGIEKKEKQVQAASSKLEYGLTLKHLNEMLQNDPVAIKKVIDVFVKSTRENLILLKKNKAENNSEEINKIAHRMLPMFRQVEAHQAVVLLEKLERAEKIQFSDSELTALEVECGHITRNLTASEA